MVSPLRSSRERAFSSLSPSKKADPLHHPPPPPRYVHSTRNTKRADIRKGPLWISAGILVLVPLFILNVQLWLYQDPAIQGDQLVESQHWRPPSRILAETDVAKCIQWESTGQLVWVQRDTVQILVVDAQNQWWFVPATSTTTATTSATPHADASHYNNHTTRFTKLQLVQGNIQRPPPSTQQKQQQSQPPDLYQFTTTLGDDVSPWHAAQRIVQEQWGIPSQLLRITDYDGYTEGKVPPLAQEHWKFLGRMPLMENNYFHHHHHHYAGDFSGYLYTYLWKVQSAPPANNGNAIIIALPRAEVQRAIMQQRFVEMRSLASLALALASTSTSTRNTIQ